MSKSVEYIAAIDQGTTSSRFIIFDKHGKEFSSAQKEFDQIMPQKNYVEHDPEEIWNSVVEVISEAMKKSKLTFKDIASVGITNQRETTVAFDASTGKSLSNAIVWMDMRTADLCETKKSTLSSEKLLEMKNKTGLPIVPYFSATKMAWLMENNDAVKGAAKNGTLRFCTVDSWLLYKLTNGAVFKTDVTNASRTLLMDLDTLDYSEELLQFWGLKREYLPEICPSASHFGTIDSNVLPELGSIVLSGILGDQQSALFGQACFDKGSVKNTYGTGCFMLMNTGTEKFLSKNGLLTTVAFQREGEKATYALEGSVAIGGAVVQWLRDNLGIIGSASESEKLANTVPDNGGVYFVPAFSGLFAPYWRSDARGAIVGLTRFANKAHIARAALEATAFQVNDVLQAMNDDVGDEFDILELKVDGGMAKNKLLLQMQSDISNQSIIVPEMLETTALGAAYCAALTCGVFKDFQDIRDSWREGLKVEVKLGKKEREVMLTNWKKAIKRTLDWEESGNNK